eukprot:gene6394-biopygen7922
MDKADAGKSNRYPKVTLFVPASRKGFHIPEQPARSYDFNRKQTDGELAARRSRREGVAAALPGTRASDRSNQPDDHILCAGWCADRAGRTRADQRHSLRQADQRVRLHWPNREIDGSVVRAACPRPAVRSSRAGLETVLGIPPRHESNYVPYRECPGQSLRTSVDTVSATRIAKAAQWGQRGGSARLRPDVRAALPPCERRSNAPPSCAIDDDASRPAQAEAEALPAELAADDEAGADGARRFTPAALQLGLQLALRLALRLPRDQGFRICYGEAPIVDPLESPLDFSVR